MSVVPACWKLLPEQSSGFYALGSLVSLLLLIAGLFASFFHLGHPERAWRAASQWRTSWLSREVIALPAMMGLVAAGWAEGTTCCYRSCLWLGCM